MSAPIPDEVRLETQDFDPSHVRITALEGREAISTLFDFHLDVVVTRRGAVSPDEMLGATVSLVFATTEGEVVRALHGMVVTVEDPFDTEGELPRYRLRLAPRAHRLTLVELQEIYLDLSLPEIIRQKLDLVGLGEAVEFRLIDEYDKRELVTQYRETDCSFIARLTEHVGVSFVFDHSGGEDKLVFADHMAGFAAHADPVEVPFRERGDRCDVFRIAATTQLIPATYAVQDYNYRTPLVHLSSVHELGTGYAGGVIEYGTHFKTPAEGDRFARIRAEEREATRKVFEGESDRCTFSAGARFRLSGHAALEDTDFLLTEVAHRAVQPADQAGAPQKLTYSNSFKAVPASSPYRPPRRTPRPRIHGLLNAIIDAADAPGRLAKLDPEGRYTVQFIFDTAASAREKASRPVRMIQNHAGPGYGTHFPLKPGIEVLLAFIDGDPDRPIIVGSVPNPTTPTPVTAVNATKNQIKTRSGVVFEIDDGS